VGYNSLSHFSQAFHETFGCCPGLYPLATPSQKLTAPHLRKGAPKSAAR
jgi:AraC-like DNA-binding protein